MQRPGNSSVPACKLDSSRPHIYQSYDHHEVPGTNQVPHAESKLVGAHPERRLTSLLRKYLVSVL